MTQGWEESTESKYLAGTTLPPTGISCTLMSIRREQMQDRNEADGVMTTVFIGTFAEPDVKDWVINKTGRQFLRLQGGITDANVAAFAPIPLLLMQTPARGNFPPGIGAMLRDVPEQAAQPSGVPPQLAPPDDDVPF